MLKTDKPMANAVRMFLNVSNCGAEPTDYVGVVATTALEEALRQGFIADSDDVITFQREVVELSELSESDRNQLLAGEYGF